MPKEKISFADFQKLDLRVAKILNVEDIEGADKLYKLTIDLGKELGERIIVAGIKDFYNKEELKNKKIIVVANLEPKKLRGTESNGMLLAVVKEKNGKEENVVLLEPEKDIEIGNKVC